MTSGFLDRTSRVFLVLVLGAAVLVPVLNLAVPVGSPFHVSDYLMPLLGKYFCFALLALSVDLIWGFAGILSLGHGAFFALGAYATAILMSHLDWSFWATLPVSAAVCGVVGYGIGFPALRLGGLYLALTTFSLAVAVPQILKHKSIEDWTGGCRGCSSSSRTRPPGCLGR